MSNIFLLYFIPMFLPLGISLGGFIYMLIKRKYISEYWTRNDISDTLEKLLILFILSFIPFGNVVVSLVLIPIVFIILVSGISRELSKLWRRKF